MELRTRNIMVKKKRIPRAGEDRYYRGKDPKGCGYGKKFRYNIKLDDYGVPAECLHWARANCKCKWGWWFKPHTGHDTNWNPEKQDAYMSFNSSKEAVLFWWNKEKILNDNN